MKKSFSDYGIHGIEGKSGETTIPCPECSAGRKKSKDKCLSVNMEKETWFCHHCQFSGGLGNKQESMGRHYKRPIKANKPAKKENQTLSGKSRAWLNGRGITDEVLSKMKITDGMEWMPQTQKEENCIQFPYFRDGEIVNIKYRDGQKHFKMVRDCQIILYGEVSGPHLIWTEGEIDVLSIQVSGLKGGVSVPNGANSKLDEVLPGCEEAIKTIKKHYIAVDNDEPGIKLRDELIRRLGPEKCWIVEWPEGCKDANDTLMAHGVEGIKDSFISAQPVPISGIYHIDDISDNLLAYYKQGEVRGARTGWHKLNHFYTVKTGEWTLISGIPSHGKSSFLDALLINLASEEDWHFGVCSPENQPLERHASKLVEIYIGKSFHGPKDERVSMDDLERSRRWLNDHFSFVLPDEDRLTVDSVLELARALVFRKGIKGLVIDPWNELDHSRPTGLSETEYISECLTKIRRFARKYGVHIFLVAHPTKIAKNKDGSYGVPRPYDISGSAHWANKADNCITVWRDVKNGGLEVQIHVQKIRFKDVGRIGMAYLYYELKCGRYHGTEQ